MEQNEQTTLHAVSKLPLTSLVLYRNPRTDLGDIELLIEQIIAAGKVNEPLTGFVKGGDFNVIEGKRRYTALRELEKRGGYDEIINNVPVQLTEDTDDVSISYRQLISFSRKDLTPLEWAEEIDRMSSQFGVSTEELSYRLKWTPVYINQLKRLANVPESIKEAIRKGLVSATSVRDAMKNGKLDELIALIEEMSNGEAESEGGGVQGEKKEKAKVKGPNSLRDFRRFMKVFSRVYGFKADMEVFEFAEAIANNELSYDDIVRRFVSDKNKAKAYITSATVETKAPVDVSEKKPAAPLKKVEELNKIADGVKNEQKAPKKAVAAPKKAVAPKKAKEAVKGAESGKKAPAKKVAAAKKEENKIK